MQSSNAPIKLKLPFAASGAKNTIPNTSQIGIVAGAASYPDGFPPLTRTPIVAGGVPPSGTDMNGVLFEMTAIARWLASGAGFTYDSAWASDALVGGYPVGARVLRTDGVGYWLNTTENNATDPEAGGAGWVPDFVSGYAAVTMAGSNVTMTPLQYGKPIIWITGTLSANVNLIFPALASKWVVINDTTGAFSITCKTASGTGVTVSATTSIVCDGINIRNANQVPQTLAGNRNVIVDGACAMAQLAPKTITTSAQYGAVDMFAAWGAGSAVSAGSITQNTTAPIGQEGYSLHLSGVTITGSGVVYARHRIESAIARRLKNKTASFSVLVHHDVGSDINYRTTIRKANAADNFSGVTTIAASSVTSVPTVTGTLLAFSGVTMGDCSNGIEIEVNAACGAVTTKNFHFTEWQLEAGANATSFEIPPINVNIAAVERYLEKTYDLGVLPGTVTFSGAVHGDASAISDITCPFRSRKRIAPTVTFYSALSGSSGLIAYQNSIMAPAPSGDTAVTGQRISTANIVVESNAGDAYMPIIHYVADARL